MGRRRTNPASAKKQFLLPVKLIEKIEYNAEHKTFGNQSRLLIEILEGRMVLDSKPETEVT